MKRIYEVEIASSHESAVRRYKVLRENVTEAAKAALRAYHSNGDKLYGYVRVTQILETGELDG